MGPDLKKAFEQALNKKVLVSHGNKKVLMTRLDIGLEQLLNQFAKGDRYARRDVMEIADKLGIDFLAKHRQAVEEALSPSNQVILDSYVARRSGTGEVAPAAPLLASPELLDDDAAAAEAAVASPPTAVTAPESPHSPGAKADAEAKKNEKRPAQKLDQASYGRGRPPPGGFSVTTGKWS